MTVIMKTLCAFVLLSVGLFSSMVGAQESGADVGEGEALYVSHQCWQCHGYVGQGGNAGVRIAPTLYPFEAFAYFVRHPNLMPAYSPNVLSDGQLRQIWAFLRAIPEPPALEDIPELSGD